MPRDLKPYVVDKILHPSNRSVLELFFDRNKHVFFAEIAMERVEHTDIGEARKLAKDLLIRGRLYAWEPVIIVEKVDEKDERLYYGRNRHDGGEHQVRLEFSFSRCDRAPHHAEPKRWYSRLHQEDFDKEVRRLRKIGAAASATTREERRATNVELEELRTYDANVIPYSGDLWDGLAAIELSIKLARKQLAELTGRKDFAERVAHLMRNPHERLFSASPGRRPPPALLPMKRFGGSKT